MLQKECNPASCTCTYLASLKNPQNLHQGPKWGADEEKWGAPGPAPKCVILVVRCKDSDGDADENRLCYLIGSFQHRAAWGSPSPEEMAQMGLLPRRLAGMDNGGQHNIHWEGCNVSSTESFNGLILNTPGGGGKLGKEEAKGRRKEEK